MIEESTVVVVSPEWGEVSVAFMEGKLGMIMDEVKDLVFFIKTG